MDIRVYDRELNLLGVTDELQTVIWTMTYYTFSQSKILATMTENNRTLFVAGNIVVKRDEYIDYEDGDGNAWRRGALITYVRYCSDEKGQEQIEISCRGLNEILNDRVVSPQLQIEGTCQDIANRLVERNAGSDADTDRQFPQFEILTQDDLGGSTLDYSNDGLAALGDEVKSVCQRGQIGFDIFVCEKLKTYGFYVYKGLDLTADNSDDNPPCIFSREYDNVTGQEYENDITNQKTYAFVQGAENSQGTKEVVEIEGVEASGFDRKEIFIDASDISRTAENDQGEQVDIPAAKYTAMLRTRGGTELAKCVERFSFDSSVNLSANLRYKVDFDMGDRVTCIDKTWGIKRDQRITSITQTYEAAKNLIEVSFGESAPTLLEMVKRVR